MRTAGPKRHDSSSTGRHNPIKHKRKPPKGMYLDQNDLLAMVSGPPNQPEIILKALDSELVSLKRMVQNNKQLLGQQKHKLGSGVDDFKPPEPGLRVNARWTNEELLLAVQGVRKYGEDFKAISEVIGNKTEAHVRSFFVNFRRRYNLDEVLEEYKKEHGKVTETKPNIKADEDEVMEAEEKMEIDAEVPVNGHSTSADKDAQKIEQIEDTVNKKTDTSGKDSPPVMTAADSSTDVLAPTPDQTTDKIDSNEISSGKESDKSQALPTSVPVTTVSV